MFRRLYPWMLLAGGFLIGVLAAGRLALHAQDRGQRIERDPGRARRAVPAPEPAQDQPAAVVRPGREPARSAQGSVQDVLLRPFHFSFARPTPLTQVCLHLKESLGVPVVLDIAALGRQDVDPDDTVQLELDGVRLKTGLKLLLDQVGLTYHVVPEDNLLIITDREGSDDPLDRIWNELRTLHRDLHDVQDAVDELSDTVAGDKGEGPRVRKPTIIEEKPDRDPFAPNSPKDRGDHRPHPARSPARPRGPRRAAVDALESPARDPATVAVSSFVTRHWLLKITFIFLINQ